MKFEVVVFRDDFVDMFLHFVYMTFSPLCGSVGNWQVDDCGRCVCVWLIDAISFLSFPFDDVADDFIWVVIVSGEYRFKMV